MTPLLKARGVRIAGRLEPTDLDVGQGELVALIGPNGGGKTSLLRALGAIEHSSGQVTVDGEALATARPSRRSRLVGFLPASREIAWPIAARDIIALGLPSPDAGRIAELLSLLELETLADRPADRLSTGERARVLLARALSTRPKLLLLDEPLSNLDPYWVLRILDLLQDMTAGGTSSAVVALHDLSLVDRFSRVILIDRGQAIADGPPADVLESAALAGAFRLEKVGAGWRIRRPADPRSSP